MYASLTRYTDYTMKVRNDNSLTIWINPEIILKKFNFKLMIITYVDIQFA